MRAECDFCKRAERWEKRAGKQHLRKYFTPRQQKDILRCEMRKKISLTQSLFLHGGSGVGKTVFACQLVYQQMKENFINQSPKTYMFVNVLDMLEEIRKSYAGNEQVIEKYKHTDYLILDDLNVSKITEWVLQIFYLIINYRYEYEKITIVTSNLDYVQLIEKLQDELIVNRMKRSYKSIKMTTWKEK
jgi:DNA replication protein DnaC